MASPTTNPLGYLGTDSVNPRDTFYRDRAPVSQDVKGYKAGDRWIDRIGANAYILISKSATSATWKVIS